MNNLFKSFRKKYHLGLVLSGGGARGFAHLGAAKALYEQGYKYDVIIGTSMGAMVGCVLADGYHPDEIYALLTSEKIKSFVRPDITKNGLMTMKGVRAFLEEVLRSKNIEDLPTPFIATATNLQKGQTHYFTRGNIIDSVIASSSIPVVFAPIIIDGVQYVDGGVLNNLPARHIRKDCKKIVGFHVNPQTLGLHNGTVNGIIQIAERTFYLAMLGNVIPDKLLCDLFIEHKNLDEYAIFDFDKMQEIFNKGYINTKKALNKYKHNLD
jgi:NTE family protein